MRIIVAIKTKKERFHECEGERDQRTSFLLESPQIKNPRESNNPEIKLEIIFFIINDLSSVIFRNQHVLIIINATDMIMLIFALWR